jgi:hypothetical protein
MRSAPLQLLAAVSLAACLRDHPTGLVEIDRSDCVACHEDDYAGATEPVHVGEYPATCADCHATSAWRPALDGTHPEDAFPVRTGEHDEVLCLDCHDATAGSSVAGANTDCIGCHTGDHARAEMDDAHGGVADYQFDDAMPHFCLSCHPDGRAPKHPDSAFPIASGPHEDIDCDDCHDRDLGADTDGANVSCIGCHTGEHSRSEMADDHDEVDDYAWDASRPAFCRSCHPRGRE